MVGMAVLITVTSAADMKVEISMAAMTGRRARIASIEISFMAQRYGGGSAAC